MKLFDKPEYLEEVDEIDEIGGGHGKDKNRLVEHVDYWLELGTNRIVAYVGAFGSGKTVVLNRAKDEFIKKKNAKWVDFDIWRYSNRQQIWDGFVIETIYQLSSKKRKTKKDIANDLDAPLLQRSSLVYSFIKRFFIKNKGLDGEIATYLILWAILSLALWALTLNYEVAFLRAFLIYSVPVFFIALALMGIRSLEARRGLPIKRVFLLENELRKKLKRAKKPIVVVVEDVDRSGEDGMIFMETLRNFLKKESFNKPVVVIAPQDRTYFNILQENFSVSLDRAIKIYDDVIYSKTSRITGSSIENILDGAKINPEYREKFEEIIRATLKGFNAQMNIRKLKFILRELNNFVEAYDGVNPALCLVLLFSRYVYAEEGRNNNKNKVRVSQSLNGKKKVRRKKSSFASNNYVIPFGKLIYNMSGATDDYDEYALKYREGQSEEIETEQQKSEVGNVIGLTIYLKDKYKMLL